MAIITADRLKALSPTILATRATDYAPALDGVLAMAELNTSLRVSHFMAQLAYESAGFKALVESLAYQAATLVKVFPSRVKTLAQAQQLVAQGPAAIANAIYGNRTDLGNTQPGDGYAFIGRGFIMITGRANYTRYATLIGQPLVQQPQLLQEALYAAQAAAAFWKATNINAKADLDDVAGVTRLVNGGETGLAGREALLKTAKTIWPASLFPSTPAPTSPAPAPTTTAPAAPNSNFGSRYFTLDALTFSDTASRLHIDNAPPSSVVTALADTAARLDQVCDLLAKPVLLVSGYRCPDLNAAMGGKPTSSHVSGRAVDFICRDFGSPQEICQKIVKSGIKFDQLIQEGEWVHISFDPQMRNQVLTANFANGMTSYTHGL